MCTQLALEHLFLPVSLYCCLFFFLEIFKVFIEFVTVLLLLLMFCVLGHQTCAILAPRPGVKPLSSPALEGKALTTREVPPPKPLFSFVSITLLRLEISLYLETQNLR